MWVENDRKAVNKNVSTFFREYCKDAEWKQHLPYISSAMECYMSRLVPQYMHMSPRYNYKINIDPKTAVEVVNSLFAAAMEIQFQLTWVGPEERTLSDEALVPGQLDFVILHHPDHLQNVDEDELSDLDDESESEDSSDSDDANNGHNKVKCETLWEGNGQNEDNNFIEDLLTENDIKHKCYKRTDERWDRWIKRAIHKTPRKEGVNQRVVMLLDRSQLKSNGNVICIQPPAPYDRFEGFSTLTHPALHMNSIVE